MNILKNVLITTVTAVTLLGASAALADGIMVKSPWSRASAGMARAGGAFMTIHNSGATADKLLAAKSDIAARVELHTHVMDGDIMKMTEVESILVPAGGMQMLKPGSYHVMFMGLKDPLKEGGSFPLTLVFENAGEVSVTVDIKAPGAKGAMDGMKNMGHDTMKKEMGHGKMKMGK